jgi:hypothetical protein
LEDSVRTTAKHASHFQLIALNKGLRAIYKWSCGLLSRGEALAIAAEAEREFARS